MNSATAGAVVVGASAGAVEALSTLLPLLPRTFSLPIVIVVHLPADRPSLLTEVFRNKCLLQVEEIEDKVPLQGGTIYFAPPDYHVLIDTGLWFSLDSDVPVMYSRPSIDVLFESAAEVYHERLIGVILSGANHDGAAGLQKIIAAGGRGLIQNQQSAAATTMVQAAAALCPTAEVLSLEQIARVLMEVDQQQ